MELINFRLLAEPYNWIIVVLILVIGAMGLHLIVSAGSPQQDFQPIALF